MAEKKKSEESYSSNRLTPSLDNLKKTEWDTYERESTVGDEGGGVGANREAWGGARPSSPPSSPEEEQHETD